MDNNIVVCPPGWQLERARPENRRGCLRAHQLFQGLSGSAPLGPTEYKKEATSIRHSYPTRRLLPCILTVPAIQWTSSNPMRATSAQRSPRSYLEGKLTTTV
jgi:hypothetical protein